MWEHGLSVRSHWIIWGDLLGLSVRICVYLSLSPCNMWALLTVCLRCHFRNADLTVTCFFCLFVCLFFLVWLGFWRSENCGVGISPHWPANSAVFITVGLKLPGNLPALSLAVLVCRLLLRLLLQITTLLSVSEVYSYTKEGRYSCIAFD